MKKTIFLTLFMTMALIFTAVNNAAAEKASDVARLIEDLQVGQAAHYKGLTIIPVYSTRGQDRVSFITLEEAFNKKYLEVTEMQGARVPQVKIANNSDKYIYLRRWTEQSRNFYSKGNLGTFEQRAAIQNESGYNPQKQQHIWDGISVLNRKMKISSRSDAYQAVYENEDVKKRVSSYERKMSRLPHMNKDTIGVVIAVGGRIVSADIFADTGAFRKLWPKLLKSSALAAINHEEERSLTPEDAAKFLRDLRDKDYAQKSGVDEGTEFSAVDDEVNVNALVFGNTVIHIAAFPQWDDGMRHGCGDDRLQERRIRVMDN